VAVRTLISVPVAKAGEVVEVRTTISHPMETGFRTDSEGRIVARDIIRRFTAQLDGQLVFSAQLHPAIAAYPYLAFALRATKSGTLTLTWEGDNGFAHTETRPLTVG
jgi:sulfur-oxidizing protein SoxZ